MRTPPIFEQDQADSLLEMIADYPFATLIADSRSGCQIHHLPFIVDPATTGSFDTGLSAADIGSKGIELRGHIAKVNTLWKDLSNGADVTLVFHGPNCYVSPDYYPTKKEHGKAVPTWNYVVVHLRGKVSFIHDPIWNLEMLNLLTDKHESARTSPWSVADAPQDYTEKMLSAIVGLKVEVSEMSGQWKLSQNQPEQNRISVVDGLRAELDPRAHAVAELVSLYALPTSD